MTKGSVFNIQHACDHDGPGMRTSIFLKGCSLACSWCHNPESWSYRPNLLYDAGKCIGCGQCARICPQGCHSLQNGGHRLDRADCSSCGACVSVCPGALEMCGQEMTAADVMQVALEDRIFYDSTGGGVTITGGEPLEQPAFTRAILSGLKAAGVHTCLETSVHADSDALRSVLPFVDLLLLDYKLSTAGEYAAWTASDGSLIRSNLQLLAEVDIPIWLRCPYVPGVHGQSHFAAIARTASALPAVQQIHVMPYHKLGLGKYEAMGCPLPRDVFRVPDPAEVQTVIAAIQSRTTIPVARG